MFFGGARQETATPREEQAMLRLLVDLNLLPEALPAANIVYPGGDNRFGRPRNKEQGRGDRFTQLKSLPPGCAPTASEGAIKVRNGRRLRRIPRHRSGTVLPPLKECPPGCLLVHPLPFSHPLPHDDEPVLTSSSSPPRSSAGLLRMCRIDFV